MPEVSMHFDVVRSCIADELAIAADSISPGTQLVGDLSLDSLDILNVIFRIEQRLKRKFPIQEWQTKIDENGGSMEEFSVANLCRWIDSAG